MCGPVDREHTAARLAAYAKTHGITFVDPGSGLRARAAHGEKLYLPEDIHLGPLGHLRVGESLAQAIVPLFGGKAVEPQAEKPHKRRQVGAYWYSWYRAQDWSTFTDYTPKGGGYVSDDAKAIARQILQAERGEIDFLFIELRRS
jgi:hypothetical protein